MSLFKEILQRNPYAVEAAVAMVRLSSSPGDVMQIINCGVQQVELIFDIEPRICPIVDVAGKSRKERKSTDKTRRGFRFESVCT